MRGKKINTETRELAQESIRKLIELRQEVKEELES